jgi:hypothetical protein
VQPEDFDRFPAERVLWTGSPVRHPAPDATDMVLLAMGLAFLLFSAFWVTSTVRNGAAPLFAGFGALIGLSALVQTWGTVAYRHLMLRHAVYTVTDQRLVVVTNALGRHKEESSYLAELRPPVLKERPDGVGSITFGTSNPFAPRRSTKFSRSWTIERPIALYGIGNARHVRDLVVSHRGPRSR